MLARCQYAPTGYLGAIVAGHVSAPADVEDLHCPELLHRIDPNAD
ncbi:hypothetical protein [Streptomyces sp. So13.3]|nr:hypothetical protein [Streptomyces sp. So13.3]